MSSGKFDSSGAFHPVRVQAQGQELVLPAGQVVVRKNGIEFLSAKPIPEWKEVVIDLRAPGTGARIQGTGVVVDCTGNRHTGYVVSVMFMDLTQESRQQLGLLARASAG
jgi:hypothetical protein